jgi:hypothetical protein
VPSELYTKVIASGLAGGGARTSLNVTPLGTVFSIRAIKVAQVLWNVAGLLANLFNPDQRPVRLVGDNKLTPSW